MFFRIWKCSRFLKCLTSFLRSLFAKFSLTLNVFSDIVVPNSLSNPRVLLRQISYKSPSQVQQTINSQKIHLHGSLLPHHKKTETQWKVNSSTLNFIELACSIVLDYKLHKLCEMFVSFSMFIFCRFVFNIRVVIIAFELSANDQ